MTTIIDKKLNYKNDDINTNISNDSKNNKVKKNDTRTRSNSSDNTSSFDPNESDSESYESKSSVSESEIEETIITSNNRKRKRLTEVDLSSHIKQKRKFSDATDNMKEVDRLNNLLITDNIESRIALMKTTDEIKLHTLKLYKQFLNDNENGASLKVAVENILSIPWGKKYNIPVKIGDPFESISSFLNNSMKLMNEDIFGHDSIKTQILEFLSHIIVDPKSVRILGLEGPPGVGKTSLTKTGIAKALGYPFSTILLSGSNDPNYLLGHSTVWKGAHSGCLLQSLISSNCMNPVLYFDELDKCDMETQKILIHLTDPLNNSKIIDKFTGIELDFSSSIIIFSYNNKEHVHPALLNRIHKITIGEYSEEDKFQIMKFYKIPELMESFKINIKITDEQIKKINSSVDTEPGVRNVIQKYESIFSKMIYNIITVKKTYELYLKGGLFKYKEL